MVVDLRPVAPASLPETVLALFDLLPESGSFLLVSDKDPRSGFEALLGERRGLFAWRPHFGDAGDYRVEVCRLPSMDDEASIIEFYGRDHDEIDLFLSYLREDIDGARRSGYPAPPSAQAYFDAFDHRLDQHIRREESILFPAVEAREPALVRGPGQVLRREHREMGALKERLRALLRGEAPTFVQVNDALLLVDALTDLFVSHHRKEESIYYPMSERLLRPDEQARVLQETRALR